MNNHRLGWFSLSFGIASLLVACASADSPAATGGSAGSSGGSAGSTGGSAGTTGGSAGTTGGSAGTTGGSGGGGETFTVPACVAAVQPFKGCSGTGCHSSGSLAAAGLHLDANSIKTSTNYKDVTAKGYADGKIPEDSCTGLGKIVDSSDVTKSLMLTKLVDKPSCGLKMPASGPDLTADQKACILEYVKAVAGVK